MNGWIVEWIKFVLTKNIPFTVYHLCNSRYHKTNSIASCIFTDVKEDSKNADFIITYLYPSGIRFIIQTNRRFSIHVSFICLIILDILFSIFSQLLVI